MQIHIAINEDKLEPEPKLFLTCDGDRREVSVRVIGSDGTDRTTRVYLRDLADAVHALSK